MCIFCQIIAKEIPADIVYEDENVLAIYDIAPAAKGHTLVMPKAHYANLLLLPEDLAGKLNTAIIKITQQLEKQYQASGFNIISNVNEVAGQSVAHCHIHIIPRFTNDGLKTLLDKAN